MKIPLLVEVAICAAVCAGGCASLPSGGIDALAGTWWVLDSLGGQAATAGTDGSPLTLMFTTDGTGMAGYSGCNQYGARVAIQDDGRIVVDQLYATKMACDNLVYEWAFLDALKKTASFRLEGDRLIFNDAAGSEVAVFQKSSPPDQL
ncbi:MAG: META domain-containing protein [Spirochaetia bacterium]|nr:META domain-containing protein [Spirochaetia bacterium]